MTDPSDRRPKIVIGYDGGPASDDALALGAALCPLLDARPLVLSVAPWPRFMHGESLRIALELDAAKSLTRAVTRLAGLDPMVKAVAHRSASEELGLVARNEEAIAIVIGACHRGRLGQVVLGSVGASLVHGAPCAVSVAPLGYRETAGPFESIAVAFDGSPESWLALEAGTHFARRAGAALSVLSVADTAFPVSVSAWPNVPLGEMIEFEQEHAHVLLDEALSTLPSDLSPEARYLEGMPRELLLGLTGEYDLMLAGSRGHGPLGQTILGTVSHALIAGGSRCPVMVLPRPAKLTSHPLAQPGAEKLSL